jgi:1-deoxy-D-xylulose-5-phosphate synthase
MKKHKIIITLEDGILDGGWGQKIASYYGTSNIKVKNYGLKKEFTDRYNLYDIFYDNRLINRLIVKDIIQLMEKK